MKDLLDTVDSLSHFRMTIKEVLCQTVAKQQLLYSNNNKTLQESCSKTFSSLRPLFIEDIIEGKVKYIFHSIDISSFFEAGEISFSNMSNMLCILQRVVVESTNLTYIGDIKAKTNVKFFTYNGTHSQKCVECFFFFFINLRRFMNVLIDLE